MEKNTVRVYDTISKKIVDVEVSNETCDDNDTSV